MLKIQEEQRWVGREWKWWRRLAIPIWCETHPLEINTTFPALWGPPVPLHFASHILRCDYSLAPVWDFSMHCLCLPTSLFPETVASCSLCFLPLCLLVCVSRGHPDRAQDLTLPLLASSEEHSSGCQPRGKELREPWTWCPAATDKSGCSRNEFQANIPTKSFKVTFKWELGVNGFLSLNFMPS